MSSKSAPKTSRSRNSRKSPVKSPARSSRSKSPAAKSPSAAAAKTSSTRKCLKAFQQKKPLTAECTARVKRHLSKNNVKLPPLNYGLARSCRQQYKNGEPLSYKCAEQLNEMNSASARGARDAALLNGSSSSWPYNRRRSLRSGSSNGSSCYFGDCSSSSKQANYFTPIVSVPVLCHDCNRTACICNRCFCGHSPCSCFGALSFFDFD